MNIEKDQRVGVMKEPIEDAKGGINPARYVAGSMGSFGPDQHGTRHVYKNATFPLSSTFLGCTTEVLSVMLDTMRKAGKLG
jgi:hypothetical protein